MDERRTAKRMQSLCARINARFFTVLVRDDPSGEGEFKFAPSRGYYDAEQILFDSHRGRFIAGGV